MLFRTGMLLGLGLITSIGAQNLFLIRQSLRRDRALFCALICFLSDVILIVLSLTVVNKLFSSVPQLKLMMFILGLAFLSYIGYQCLRSSLSDNKDLTLANTQSMPQQSYSTLLLLSLGFSLLNPNAIVDTFVIIGSFASHYSGIQQVQFALGVTFASFIWFFALVTIMQKLSRYCLNPKLWRWIEFLSAMVIFTIVITQILFYQAVI